MNLRDMKGVVVALEVAEKGGQLSHHGYFDMQHDVLYLPWNEQIGLVADMLSAAGCHWDDDNECWAHF